MCMYFILVFLYICIYIYIYSHPKVDRISGISVKKMSKQKCR